MDTTNQIIKTLLQENNKLRDSKEKLYQKNKNLRQEVRNLNKANIDKLYSLRQLQDSVDYYRSMDLPVTTQYLNGGVVAFPLPQYRMDLTPGAGNPHPGEVIFGDSHGGGLPPGYGHNSGLTNPENDLKW